MKRLMIIFVILKNVNLEGGFLIFPGLPHSFVMDQRKCVDIGSTFSYKCDDLFFPSKKSGLDDFFSELLLWTLQHAVCHFGFLIHNSHE